MAIPDPRDDGAYYQALVDKVESFSKDNGYEDPIIVDNIQAEDAATELANIAEQGVDVITSARVRSPIRSRPRRRVSGHLLVLQLRRRLSGDAGTRPEPGRLAPRSATRPATPPAC